MTEHTQPHRYRIASTHRYLPILQSICTLDKPLKLTFDPRTLNVAPETAVARLRDSATAFIKGYVTHSTIDPANLATKWPLYYVTHNSGQVLVVPRAETAADPEPLRGPTVGTPAQVCSLSGVELTQREDVAHILRAFALLLGLRFIKTQVTAPKQCIPDELRQELTTNHDIAIIEDGENYIML